ncbi:ThuA domain-containing protein [Croceicoccus sp. YJ47]|uniref:ThuA domain-containing protein n=1 Tax=Croceicoccus sp. YJ47 TaxID=2798724 RepID=UPI001920B08B|nr:ThuA domain-containing protein [Croceicoccus sp. YJ47]QQN74348.1 ThuA domain-containing protein [Croceicoccus sp. YJ47]
MHFRLMLGITALACSLPFYGEADAQPAPDQGSSVEAMASIQEEPAPTKARKLNILIAAGRVSQEHDNENRTFRFHSNLLTTVLEDTGRFRVRVIEDFDAIGTEMLEGYDAVIISREGRDNYVEPAEGVGPRVDQALIQFVKDKGKGIVWFHSSSVQEEDWGWPDEYNKIRGGSVSADDGLRRAPTLDFIGQVDTTAHPITEGLLPEIFFTGDDFLVGARVFPGAKVLMTVNDDIEWYRRADWPNKATVPVPQGDITQLPNIGKPQPVAWINEYGRGRAFTIMPGHDVDTFRRLDYLVLLARGVEWAASGDVTLPRPDILGPNRFTPWPFFNGPDDHESRWGD